MAIIGIVRPNWGTPGMSLPLLPNSAALPLGKSEKISVDGVNACARRPECPNFRSKIAFRARKT